MSFLFGSKGEVKCSSSEKRLCIYTLVYQGVSELLPLLDREDSAGLSVFF